MANLIITVPVLTPVTNTVKNAHRCSCKLPGTLSDFNCLYHWSVCGQILGKFLYRNLYANSYCGWQKNRSMRTDGQPLGG